MCTHTKFQKGATALNFSVEKYSHEIKGLIASTSVIHHQLLTEGLIITSGLHILETVFKMAISLSL
jgi:hypothetical protein